MDKTKIKTNQNKNQIKNKSNRKNKSKKFQKKSNATYIFVLVITTVLFFLIYSFYITNLMSSIVPTTDDKICRAYVAAKSFPGVKIGEFFSNLNLKCKKDYIKIDSTKQDKVFTTIGDEMKRCWNRYGEGKYDFLSNYDSATGTWCFVCGELDFSDDAQIKPIYKFNDFIDWSKKTKLMLANGSQTTYYNYINMKYSNADEKKFYDLRQQIDALKEEQDSSFKELLFVLNEQYEYLYDLSHKKIKTDETNYVVYRFDRVSSGFAQRTQTALYAGVGTLIAGFVISNYIETIAWGTATSVVCGATGALTGVTLGAASPSLILCALMGGKTVESIGKDTIETSAKISKFTKLDSLASKIKESLVFTKEAKIALAFKKFTGSVDELLKIGAKVSKFDGKYGESLIELGKTLSKAGITHIDDIGTKIAAKERRIEILKDATYSLMKNNGLTEDCIKRLQKTNTKIFTQLQTLKKLQTDASDVAKMKTADITKEQASKLFKYVKTFAIVGSSIAAGTAAYQLDVDSRQHVELMTKEQYYRVCGTRSFKSDDN